MVRMRALMGAGSFWVALLGGLGLAGCAEGYEGLSSLRLNQTIPTGSAGNASQVDAGAGSGGATGMTTPPPAGTECKMGDTQPCMCSSTGTEGVNQCRGDARSSLGGYFATECTRCAPPVVMMPEDPGDVMMSDGGPATSGSGGAGSSASGSGGAGSGGRGGSGGSGGSTARPGTCMPACNNTCFPVGILPCCRPIGGCGCTWAPGAYCL